ncbi:MAG: DNA-directed RNA polymerase subunit K [Thermoproteota archaeon]|nr:DNA-directed RNA polymerase subunit K [Thermoproteota archaeon]
MVRSSSKTNAHKKALRPKQRTAKKATLNKSKVDSDNTSKKSSSHAKVLVESKNRDRGSAGEIKTTTRPEDEVVIYDEVDFELREITHSGKQILVGPHTLTRFERARITGARSLQLSLGAPSLISIPAEVKDSVSLATLELDAKALPISIRRVLPNGLYQDIPIEWLK